MSRACQASAGECQGERADLSSLDPRPAEVGSGRCRGGGQLAMGWTWNVTVTVSRGAEELGRRSFSVIAK